MKKELTLIEITDEATMREWGNILMNERKTEAIESIVKEKVTQESVFYVNIEGKKYLAFYMEGEILPADMEMQINKDHRKILKGIKIKRIDAEMLYDINTK